MEYCYNSRYSIFQLEHDVLKFINSRDEWKRIYKFKRITFGLFFKRKEAIAYKNRTRRTRSAATNSACRGAADSSKDSTQQDPKEAPMLEPEGRNPTSLLSRASTRMLATRAGAGDV